MRKENEGHIIPAENKSYNDRLFKKGIRKYFHEARFFWLRKVLNKLKIHGGSIIELGCHDGKLLKYLPFVPREYAGYDANWENGLELAAETWKNHPAFRFFICKSPTDFNPSLQKFQFAVSMETMEHLPLSDLSQYISRIKLSTERYLFLTVPNEKGPLFLLKYAVKKTFLKVDEPYSWKELLFAAVGKTEKVKRNEYGHKGFDYETLLPLIGEQFNIISVDPIPFSFLPAWMNFSVGIIAHPK